MGLMSKYIFGIHDPGPWFDMVRAAGKEAWCVYTEAIGSDPNDHSGKDFRVAGITPIVRLNYGYGEGVGTIPTPDKYGDAAQRAANFIAASQGAEFVVWGNEIALAWERPIKGVPLTLTTYADSYRQAYDAMKRANPNVKIAPAAVAPWNTGVPDAPDWIEQLRTMLNMLSSRVDWVCLHAYTRSYNTGAFATGAKMDNPTYRHRHSGWETLWEFMQAIPATMDHLPVMITEANGNGPWPSNDTGWIQAMYADINEWNATPGSQQIRAACLFRWAEHDTQWSMAHSPGAADDFRQALAHDYRWQMVDGVDAIDGGGTSENPKSSPTTTITAGDQVTVTATSVNVRNAPGLQAEVALRLSYGDRFVVEAVYSADGLIWLQGPHGWCAEVAPNGTRLVSPAPSTGSGAGGDRAAIIRRLAAEYGVDEKLARATIAVESGGRAFEDGKLVMRFEPHVFPEQFTSLFRRHFRFGEPAWKGHEYRPLGGDWQAFHGNQGAEYAAQILASEIAEVAALNAASYGLGQIMGFNHATCGYSTPQAMIHAFEQGEEAQIRAMFDYFKNRRDKTGQSCLDYLRAGDLVSFAALYNGPGQAEYYAGLIKRQLARTA